MVRKIISAAKKRRWLSAIIAAVIVIGGYYLFFRSSGNKYTFVSVKRGPITETVNVTGNTTPVKSIDLAFENGGIIAATLAPVGTHVRQGDVIARLDTQSLQANLAEAQASVDIQAAKLRSLQIGAQPADIAAS